MPIVESWASREMQHFLGGKTTTQGEIEPLGVWEEGSFMCCNRALVSHLHQPSPQCDTTFKVQVLLGHFLRHLGFEFLPLQDTVDSL